MPRFSANLGFLWVDRPLPDRIAAAASAGFAAVECHHPFDHDAAEIRAALAASGVPMLSLNTSYGPGGARDFGVAARPGREAEARAIIDEAIAYAAAIGCPNVNVVPGTTGRSPGSEETFRANLADRAGAAASEGITLLIEPLSPGSVAGAHCSRVEEAVETIAAVGEPNIKVLFDCFHVQTMQGNVTERLRASFDLIGHVQIAAVPGRAEPDHGELDHEWLFRTLDELGYAGWVGAEYHPRSTVEEGLDWFRRARTGSTT